jgi:exosome complex component RRP46
MNKMIVAAPEADLGTLPKADGSVTFRYAGYTVTASVNGPIEAARRDEHPYKAHVDVIVRPAAGTGGKPFRHHATARSCRKMNQLANIYML